jgi:cytidylate kinase
VALARQAGAPGTSVGREVAKRFGWTVYDRELLEHIAQEQGLRMHVLESLDERPQGWLRESLHSLLGVPVVTERSYVRHMAQTILSLGRLGRSVIVGRGATAILPSETTLRVRLVAPLEDRIAAYSKRYELSRDDAARRVEVTDRERISFVKNHFRVDPTDPVNYDLVLNTGRWSIEECAAMIADALQHRVRRISEKKRSPEAP